MDNDCMRYNLVTKFSCAICGSPLRVSYAKPKALDLHPEANDGITGAAKVEMTISVHPCDKCYKDAVRPLHLLSEALNLATAIKRS